MRGVLRAGNLRLMLALTSLASLAFVVQAGHRW
jgi:hypothetical protein